MSLRQPDSKAGPSVSVTVCGCDHLCLPPLRCVAPQVSPERGTVAKGERLVVEVSYHPHSADRLHNYPITCQVRPACLRACLVWARGIWHKGTRGARQALAACMRCLTYSSGCVRSLSLWSPPPSPVLCRRLTTE